MEPTECPNCGKRVHPAKGHRCPHCNTFLHPDPIKRLEAEIAEKFRHWLIEELPKMDRIQTSDYTLPTDELTKLPLSSLVELADRYLVSTLTPDGRELPLGPYFKVTIVGKRGVGVYSLFNQIARLEQNRRDSIGATFAVKDFSLLDKKTKKEEAIKVVFWLLDGHQRTASVRRFYYVGARGALVAFSLIDYNSFELVPNFIKEIDQAIGTVPKIILGTKADLIKERKVTQEEIDRLVEKLGVHYLEIDVLDSPGLDNAMQILLPMIYNARAQQPLPQSPNNQFDASFAANLRRWFIEELPKLDWIRPSDFTLDPDKLEDLSLQDLTDLLLQVVEPEPADEGWDWPSHLFFQVIKPKPSDEAPLNLLATLKVLVLGDEGIGKTSFIGKKTSFVTGNKTIWGVNMASRDVHVHDQMLGDHRVRLQIWDVHGSGRFETIRARYYRGAVGSILVFNRSIPRTFERLDKWLEEFERVCSKLPCVLVGLLGSEEDASIEPQVTRSEAEEYASQRQMPYFEVNLQKDRDFDSPWHKLTEMGLAHIFSSRTQSPQRREED